MIYIGTSGFSYNDWKGHFYPEKLAKKDMLAYYAAHFPAVEINSTYYTIPGASSFYGMLKKTCESFEFVVKAHKDMTHTEDAPREEVFDYFLGSIHPLIDSGRLGAVLAQFPWGFKNTSKNEERLKEFKERMGDVPTVVEFRNDTWVNDRTFDLLRDLNLGYCSVDEPKLKGLMPGVAVVTSEIGYVRFHGRNAGQWWKHEESHQRYDYLYSEEELQEWVPKVNEINSKAKKTYLFFNNHYEGKAPQNAMMFARMLNLGLPLNKVMGQMTLEDHA